ncbi:PAS domain-containing protein [Spirosoma sp. HMF4905]|uniref:PAS domain-containing protein n=1 Tax=Spirosoma arboris TaxID=2682092 RepID=A0A7K1SN17_9BACT|nr:PAS domain-containing protein [Spirosoma arboris]MVM34996.1 PAS domain-containing protein [Spirosoma arboris]
MDFCGPYDKYLTERHQEFLQAPLLVGWEFRQKTHLTTEGYGWMSLAKVQKWQLPASIRHKLLSDKWAIVITDTDQIIQYVNLSFEQMTGYSRQEALGRRPSFLQGEGTFQQIRQRIKQAIDRRKPVRGRLLNYRKDQTPYWCQIIILPIVNRQKQVVNFIAFEREVESE